MTATGYILCSNPRSGTTLLCDLLGQTRVAGQPDSFFRKKSMLDWCAWWNIKTTYDPKDPVFTQEYFATVRRRARGGTNMFGMRLMGPDLNFATSWLTRAYPQVGTGKNLFEAVFGKLRFIYLKRNDKLAEAVSYVRAEQSGLWHGHPDGSDVERIAPNGQVGYDRAAIARRLQELSDFDQAWENWFSAHDIAPFKLSDDTLAEDQIDVVKEILEFIGTNSDQATHILPGVRKLADAKNAEWITRFRAETKAGAK